MAWKKYLVLWPYAPRYAVHILDTAPFQDECCSRLELLAGIRGGTKMKGNHNLSCPVFALEKDLQGDNTIPKWSPCYRLGMNLGSFPLHTCIISIVSTKLCQTLWYHWNHPLLKMRYSYTLQMATTGWVGKVCWRQLNEDAWYGPPR